MADDALLTDQDMEEAISRAYTLAVAARAGYTTSVRDLDRDSIDLSIQAGGEMRPALDLQLKATENLAEASDGCRRFRLKLKNYNQLRCPTQTPRLLVVLDLPKDKNLWVTITDDKLAIRYRAYWMNLRGYEETENQTSVTVPIPEKNLFNVESLHELMEQSRSGRIQ